MQKSSAMQKSRASVKYEMNDVEQFIQDEGVDEKAAEALRELEPELQEQVMSRGTLSEGRNPSAMLIGRVRDAKKTVGLNQVEQFIQEQGVDEEAAQGLRDLDKDMQW